MRRAVCICENVLSWKLRLLKFALRISLGEVIIFRDIDKLSTLLILWEGNQWGRDGLPSQMVSNADFDASVKKLLDKHWCHYNVQVK